MANPLVLIEPVLLANELDVSCYADTVTIEHDAAALMATTFCSSGYEVPVAGRRSTVFTASGPTDVTSSTASAQSAVDQALAASLAGTWTVSAVQAGATEGNVGYFTQGTLFQRAPLDGAAGEVAQHNVEWRGGTRLVRGRLAVARTITTSSSASGVELGAVSAAQRIWCAAHFLTAGGTTPSLAVKVQSDVDNTFATPTDQITLTAQTAKGGQFASTVGPVTDTWWRVTWTVSGTSPSFITRVLIGIG